MKNRAAKLVIAHLFIGSASYASGSLMTVTCKSFALINASRLHFGQYSGKFVNSVSDRILMRVLLPHIGQHTHSINRFTLHLLLKRIALSVMFANLFTDFLDFLSGQMYFAKSAFIQFYFRLRKLGCLFPLNGM